MIRAIEHCRFEGKNYQTGEIVPASSVPKKMLGVFCNMGVIELIVDPPPVEDKSKTRKPK